MVMIGTDGRPTQKNMLTAIKEWIEFRLDVVRRRCQFDLDKINKRIHILEGRMIAFLNIDEVIKVIRNSDEPKEDLIKAFDLSDIQAEDILEIRLRQLARLEGIKIEKELEKLRKEAEGLDGILGSNTKLKNLTSREIKQDAEKYGDDRRTLIEPVERTQASQKSFVVDEPVTILLSRNGWIRARQGHGVEREAITWKAGDSELAVIETRTVRPIVILDSNGRCYAFDASSVPRGKGDGIPVSSIIELQNGASITAAMSGDEKDKYLFTSSNSYGFIAPLKGLIARPKAGKAFIKVEGGVKVLEPIKLDDCKYIAVTSSENKLLVFSLGEINEYPNGGRGVKIMDIPKGKVLTSVELSDGEAVNVVVKGKKKAIKGEVFAKYLSKRARKGVVFVAAKAKSKRQKGLF
jgi:topoisomerase-4 subunit A